MVFSVVEKGGGLFSPLTRWPLPSLLFLFLSYGFLLIAAAFGPLFLNCFAGLSFCPESSIAQGSFLVVLNGFSRLLT